MYTTFYPQISQAGTPPRYSKSSISFHNFCHFTIYLFNLIKNRLQLTDLLRQASSLRTAWGRGKWRTVNSATTTTGHTGADIQFCTNTLKKRDYLFLKPAKLNKTKQKKYYNKSVFYIVLIESQGFQYSDS